MEWLVWLGLLLLRPLKRVSNFLYVCTHWETISGELKKRDERPQAIEEWADKLMRLKEQAHTEEMRELERRLERERAEWRGPVESLLVKFAEARRQAADLRGERDYILGWLTIVLYAGVTSAERRDEIISNLPPEQRERVSKALVKLAEEPHSRRCRSRRLDACATTV